MSHLRRLLKSREVRLAGDPEPAAGVSVGSIGVIECIQAYEGIARVAFGDTSVVLPLGALQPVERRSARMRAV